jgi:hypothetical protein
MAQQSSANTSSTLGKMIIDRLFPIAPEPAIDNGIYGKYYYKAIDFGDQSYEDKFGILTGKWLVPIYDDNSQVCGTISWYIIAPGQGNSDYSKEKFTTHETVMISFGLEHNATTHKGSGNCATIGGYYEEGLLNKICMYGCNGEESSVSITNNGGGVREVVVKRVSNIKY